MLSIAPIAGGGAGYYTAQDNYYFLGSMQSRWLGEGGKVAATGRAGGCFPAG